MRKITAAAALGSALWLLSRVGYEPNVAQGPGVQLALRILYAVVPGAFNAAAIVVMLRYPINRARHDEIRAATRDQGMNE